MTSALTPIWRCIRVTCGHDDSDVVDGKASGAYGAAAELSLSQDSTFEVRYGGFYDGPKQCCRVAFQVFSATYGAAGDSSTTDWGRTGRQD